MKFTFTCKKVALNDSVKEYAEKKISKLDRYFREDADALVTFAVEKDNRCVVEVTIRGGGTIFRAQEETRDGDIRSIIDAASATIDRQIRKNRTRPEQAPCARMLLFPKCLQSLRSRRSRSLRSSVPSTLP